MIPAHFSNTEYSTRLSSRQTDSGTSHRKLYYARTTVCVYDNPRATVRSIAPDSGAAAGHSIQHYGPAMPDDVRKKFHLDN